MAETHLVMPVSNGTEAERLVSGVLAVMADLSGCLESETAHLRAGRIREGLSGEARKADLAASYLRGLEAIKANAVALQRLAPEILARFKKAQARFANIVETNQAVLATARAVSENLVKGIAEEMDRHARPPSYAPLGMQMRRPETSGPLVVSKSL